MPTQPQIKRLYTIASSHGWSHAGVIELISVNYRIGSTYDLTDQQYEEVVEFIESCPATDVVTMHRDQDTQDLPF